MDTKEIIKKNYQYFVNNHKLLTKEYLNKFLVIKDEKVQKAFDVESEAYFYAVENFGLGNFIIQQCVADLDTLTQTFHSRVRFGAINY